MHAFLETPGKNLSNVKHSLYAILSAHIRKTPLALGAAKCKDCARTCTHPFSSSSSPWHSPREEMFCALSTRAPQSLPLLALQLILELEQSRSRCLLQLITQHHEAKRRSLVFLAILFHHLPSSPGVLQAKARAPLQQASLPTAAIQSPSAGSIPTSCTQADFRPCGVFGSTYKTSRIG